MRKARDIKELFAGGSGRLTQLKERACHRSRVLDQVIAALPAELAARVSTAGIDAGQLTVGAMNAAWATRLRYMTDTLRQRVGDALGVEISKVRVRVVTSAPPKPRPR